jgi:hypothetical protein
MKRNYSKLEGIRKKKINFKTKIINIKTTNKKKKKINFN